MLILHIFTQRQYLCLLLVNLLEIVFSKQPFSIKRNGSAYEEMCYIKYVGEVGSIFVLLFTNFYLFFIIIITK